jgi:hypothetical protein
MTHTHTTFTHALSLETTRDLLTLLVQKHLLYRSRATLDKEFFHDQLSDQSLHLFSNKNNSS